MGKIYLRGDMWWSNYSAAGRRHRKPLSPNKRLAQAMQDELLAVARSRRRGLIPQNVRLDFFLHNYLRMSKDEKSKNTYAHDVLAFRRLRETFPYLTYVQEITPELLQEAKLEWKDEGFGPGAIGSYVMRIKVAMKIAEEWRYVEPQNWPMVQDYVAGKRVIYYSLDELNRMIAETSGIWKTSLLLMARAGLRTGEVLNLEWSDIDFADPAVHIHAKPFWKPKGWAPKRPQERFIDMPPDLVEHLKTLPRAPGFVLGHDRPSVSIFAHYFKDLISSEGLKGSAHSFRHTYASMLISEGCSLEEVGELLGHSNPTTTKIYAHLMPHAKKRAVARLPPLVAVL